MKRILLTICAVLVLAGPCFGATWYACAGSKNIDSVSSGTTSDVWYSEAACSGGSYYAWTSVFNDGLNAGDILEANAQTAILVNVNPGATGKKVHLKNLNGGNFTFTFNTLGATTINADITAGTADCLLVSGAGSAGTELTIVGNLTGGGTSGADAVYDTHTGAGAIVAVTGALTGGTSTQTPGYNFVSATGSVTITGNVTASANCYALRVAGAAPATVEGDCIGTDTAEYPACYAAMGPIIVTGNIVNGTRSTGGTGAIRWQPSSSQKYMKFNGGGTVVYASAGLGSDSDGTQITGENTAAKVSTGTYFIKKDDGVHTQGSASSSGGGGAWGF